MFSWLTPSQARAKFVLEDTRLFALLADGSIRMDWLPTQEGVDEIHVLEDDVARYFARRETGLRDFGTQVAVGALGGVAANLVWSTGQSRDADAPVSLIYEATDGETVDRVDEVWVVFIDDDKVVLRDAEAAVGAHQRNGSTPLKGAYFLSRLLEWRGKWPEIVRAARRVLVFLDLRFGDNTEEAFDWLAAMKASPSTRHVPIVILSASDHPNDVQRAYALGANGYVCKGVGDLEGLIRECLDYWTRHAELPAVHWTTNVGQGKHQI